MRGSDGFDALGFSGTPGSMRSPDMEMFELSTPHFMEYYEYLPDSAGAGRWRGGLGTTSSWRFYGEGELGVSIGDDAASEGADPAAGLFGGEPAGLNDLELHFPDGTMRNWGSKEIVHDIPVGTICVARNGGGGGYGHPHERDAPTVAGRGARRARVRREGARELRRRRAARPLGHRRGRDRAPARGARMSYRVGIDVGGTFTDFLVIGSDGRRIVHKTSSTPDDPSVGVATGLARDRRRARHRRWRRSWPTSRRSCTARPSPRTPC